MQDGIATPAGIVLGPLDAIADGTAQGFMLETAEGLFRGLIVRRGDAVHGYVDRCPHARVPLVRDPGDYLTPAGDLIQCSWHGALFVIRSGRCIAGPCKGERLMPWPVAVVDGIISTA